MNPYKTIPGLYDNDKIDGYQNKYLGDMPPHIYAIANEAYYALWRKGGNQCVLIRWVVVLSNDFHKNFMCSLWARYTQETYLLSLIVVFVLTSTIFSS